MQNSELEECGGRGFFRLVSDAVNRSGIVYGWPAILPVVAVSALRTPPPIVLFFLFALGYQPTLSGSAGGI